MIAKKLINEMVPPLKPGDTGKKALRWMGEFHVHQLAVVESHQLLGIISEYDLLDQGGQGDVVLRDIIDPSEKVFVLEHQHIYEAIKLMHQHSLSTLPVANGEGTYLGMITQESVIHYLATSSSFQESGGIIVLNLATSDYTMSEIAQIVESNNARILSSYATTISDSNRMEVTLKLNLVEIDSVISTFERYGYSIKASYQELGQEEDFQDRLDHFIHYLNI